MSFVDQRCTADKNYFNRLEKQRSLTQVSRVAWQKTREYESVRQFLFTSRGAVVVSEAQCITHKVKVIFLFMTNLH